MVSGAFYILAMLHRHDNVEMNMTRGYMINS